MSLAASIGTLCIAATILATGSLGDRLGRKKIMLAGLLVTLVGGVVTALAQNAVMFSVGRSLSGVGFAASSAFAFALLRAIAPQPDALAKTVAWWLALQTLGIVGALHRRRLPSPTCAVEGGFRFFERIG